MKASLNRVELIGNVGQEPELKTTAGGHSLVNIQIATTRGKKDAAGTWQDELTWHKVTLWNRLAEILNQYCQKGSQVYIEGYLQNNEWKNQDKQKIHKIKTVFSGCQVIAISPANNLDEPGNIQDNFRS